MASIANIVAFDGAATPVSHTFLAASVTKTGTDNIATYKEAIATVPDEAQARVTIKHSKLGSGVMRQSVRVELPVMESISGVNGSGYTAAPKVAYVDTCEVISYASARSTINGRRTARQLALNVAGSVGTSVLPVVTGPVPELMDLLIVPT